MILLSDSVFKSVSASIAELDLVSAFHVWILFFLYVKSNRVSYFIYMKGVAGKACIHIHMVDSKSWIVTVDLATQTIYMTKAHS